MDFELREEERAAAELARRILGDLATNERHKALAARGEAHDADLWAALARARLTAVAVPEEFGGSGLGFLALCALAQEVGRTVAAVPVYSSLVLGALPLARYGSAAQRSAWLPGVASGELLLTAALAEPGASDPLAPSTRMRGRGADLRLHGVKTRVPWAGQASHVLIPARDDDGHLGLCWVEPTAPGVRLAPQITSDGTPHACVELEGVRVSPEARLDGEHDGAGILRWLVERATVARCWMQLGVVERALEMTAEYGRTRIQFERPLGSFQAFHQRAADAYIAVEAIRLAAWEAGWRLSEELPASESVALAKFWAAEGGQSAAIACQHLHGGIGIDVEYPLHRHFLWALQIEHELGSAKLQLEHLGEAIARAGIPAG